MFLPVWRFCKYTELKFVSLRGSVVVLHAVSCHPEYDSDLQAAYQILPRQLVLVIYIVITTWVIAEAWGVGEVRRT